MRRAHSPRTGTSCWPGRPAASDARAARSISISPTTRSPTRGSWSTTSPAAAGGQVPDRRRRRVLRRRPGAAARGLRQADQGGGRRHHVERPRAGAVPERRLQEDLDRRAVRQRLRRRAAAASCGRFAADACAAYQASARTGEPTPAAAHAASNRRAPRRSWTRSRRPRCSARASRTRCSRCRQADANARGIAATGTPVKVVWRAGRTRLADDRLVHRDRRCDRLVRRGVPRRRERNAAVPDRSAERLAVGARPATATSGGWSPTAIPGIDGTPHRSDRGRLAGPPQQIAAPAGGVPAAISSIPDCPGCSAGSRACPAGSRSCPARSPDSSRRRCRRACRSSAGRRAKLTVTAEARRRCHAVRRAARRRRRRRSICRRSAAATSPSAGLDVVGELTGDAAGAARVAGVVVRHEGGRAAHRHGRAAVDRLHRSRPATASC